MRVRTISALQSRRQQSSWAGIAETCMLVCGVHLQRTTAAAAPDIKHVLLVGLLQGRKRSREEGGMSTVSGGMPQAAAAAAAAVAAGVQQSRLSENFYRFQQREQRRTGGARAAAVVAADRCWDVCEQQPMLPATATLFWLTLANLECRPSLMVCCVTVCAAPTTTTAELLELRQQFEEGRKRLAALKVSGQAAGPALEHGTATRQPTACRQRSQLAYMLYGLLLMLLLCCACVCLAGCTAFQAQLATTDATPAAAAL